MNTSQFETHVREWVERIQPHHWQEGTTWYKQASQFCRALSEETGTPFKNVCGVLAALSPQVSWEVNLASCESIVRYAEIDRGYTGYHINVEKALQCLTFEPLTVLRGAKVIAFYHNIVSPLTDLHVTIDTHMGRIFFDTMQLTAKQQAFLFSKKGNSVMQAVLQKVAKRKRVKPHVLQAALWTCVREKVQARADKDQLPLYIK